MPNPPAKTSKKKDPLAVLIEDLLPLSLDKAKEALLLDPIRDEENKRIPGTYVKKLNMRLLSLQSKVALGLVNVVVKLEDQTLKRKAGSKIDEVLKAIKAARPDLLAKPAKVIESSPVVLPREHP